MEDGGWGAHFDKQRDERFKREREDIRKQKLHEENLKAVTAQAKKAVEDSDEAKKSARFSNLIALWALIVAAMALAFSIWVHFHQNVAP